MTREERAELRRAVADYMASEGCRCCEDSRHEAHRERLCRLLRMRKYGDGSGYDFWRYKTEPPR